MNASDNNDDEKLIGAMEDLSIPEVNEVKEEPEVNEKLEGAIMDQELSDEDSDHSIIKQMSPISVGTPSPPSSPVPDSQTVTKRASEFVGKIPKVKKEDEEKIKEDEVKTKPKEEKRDRSREKKSSRRSYKSSRRDRDSDRRSRDRRRDSERRDRRDRNESKEKDRSKKDERYKRDEKSRREEKKEQIVLEDKPVKQEPISDGIVGEVQDLVEKVKEEVQDESGLTEDDKTDKGSSISTMTTRSRFRGPVNELPNPAGAENVYSKKYLRPARRDIR